MSKLNRTESKIAARIVRSFAGSASFERADDFPNTRVWKALDKMEARGLITITENTEGSYTQRVARLTEDGEKSAAFIRR